MTQLQACRTLNDELYDMVKQDRFEEPYFENDVISEVGHAFETHVSPGTRSWSYTCLTKLMCRLWEVVIGHGDSLS